MALPTSFAALVVWLSAAVVCSAIAAAPAENWALTAWCPAGGPIASALATFARVVSMSPPTLMQTVLAWASLAEQLRQEQDQLELAAAVAAEQVELHRRQTARDPEWNPIMLAAALLTRGEDLFGLRRHAEAALVMREATDAYRRLAAARPDDVVEQILGCGLGTLYKALWRVSRPEEAEAACGECVTVFRRLAAQGLDRFGGFLAGSANDHGFYLSSLGRHGEALAATDEAVRTRRNAAATEPRDLAFTLWTFAEVRLAARDELPLAATAIAEAAEIYGDLAKTAPEQHGDSLWQVLTMAGDIGALVRQ